MAFVQVITCDASGGFDCCAQCFTVRYSSGLASLMKLSTKTLPSGTCGYRCSIDC